MIPASLIDRAHAVRVEDEIARRGHKLHGKGADRCGRCPVCGGDDRFSINTRKQLYNCRGSGGGDIIALVQHLDSCDFQTAIETLTGIRLDRNPAPARLSPSPAKSSLPKPTNDDDDDYEREQHRKANRMWYGRQPIVGSPAEIYLRGRGISCPIRETLGYLAPRKPGEHHVLLAAYGFPKEPEPGKLAVAGGRIQQLRQ
jgi:hypothetical protein